MFLLRSLYSFINHGVQSFIADMSKIAELDCQLLMQHIVEMVQILHVTFLLLFIELFVSAVSRYTGKDGTESKKVHLKIKILIPRLQGSRYLLY